MSDERFRNAVEAALFAAGRPLSADDIVAVFADSEWAPERKQVMTVLGELAELWSARALELVEVASGWRFQVRREYSAHLGRLWSEKPPRYSRALVETLAIIAYRQPVTRGEIEDIRGVAVSPSILRTLQERDWIRVLGHKEIPGRPELLGTTRQFLDDFNLSSLEGLPALADIRDLDSLPDDLFPETRDDAVLGVASAPDVAPSDADDAVAAAPAAGDAEPSATEAGEERDASADDDAVPETDVADTQMPASADTAEPDEQARLTGNEPVANERDDGADAGDRNTQGNDDESSQQTPG